MGLPVWGWGLVTAVIGKVVEKNGNEKFGKLLMGAGAVMAIGDAVGAFSGGELATEASAMAAETGGMTSEGLLAHDAAVFGEEGLALTGETLGAGEQTIAMAGENAAFMDGSAITDVAAGAPPIADASTPGLLDSKYMLPAAVIGGQALTGWSAGKQADKDRKERERRYNEQTAFGVRRDGQGSIRLNTGEGLLSNTSRYFSGDDFNKSPISLTQNARPTRTA